MVKTELYSEESYFGIKPEISGNSKTVLERRYLTKDLEGKIIESPAGMFYRVAENIAKADLKYDSKTNIEETIETFYNLMAKGEFMPNSPTLMNAGKNLQQLSGCFVLPVGDSIEEIFDTLKYTALIHKSGGGTGFSFSKLRPSESSVASTSGVASGPISFMRVYDGATEEIKQGGTRRGANMGILRVDHPDIMKFISCKDSEKGLNNFNLSVALTKKFMDKVEKGENYFLYNPHTGEKEGELNAKEVFNEISKHAWNKGDPGIIFIDRINEYNPTPQVGEIESTNPCGEQPLLPYESCNLGSINLSKVLKLKKENLEGKLKGIGDKEVDWKKLEKVVETSVHLLDNVIDMNKYPLKKIDETTKSNRKIGLGIMGFADTLMELGIKYDSKEGIEMAEKIMNSIDVFGKKASIKLAKKKGVFPNWEGSIYDKRSEYFKGDNLNLRNATVTTIAPTGTISIIANASSGMEPLFAVAYTRTVMDKDKLVEVNPLFKKVAKDNGFYSENLMKKIAENGSLEGLDEIPDEVKNIFRTAQEISPEWHIKMQAAFQKYTDNAVSKTINMSNNVTIEDVQKAYLLAYELGCKGLTIYRDGSRDEQVLTTGKNKKQGKLEEISMKNPLKPSKIMPAIKVTQETPFGNMHTFVVLDPFRNYKEVETFSTIGNAGGIEAATLEGIGRMSSMWLRNGGNIQKIIDQYIKLGSGTTTISRAGGVQSLEMGFGKALQKYILAKEEHSIEDIFTGKTDLDKLDGEVSDMIRKGQINGNNKNNETSSSDKLIYKKRCPDCSNILSISEGCNVCRSCGYSDCS